MIRLITHLEHLLRIHDCVIVPRLGGFVLQVVPATHVIEDHLFKPMHKEVVFNAKLQHTDGLLHERYMQAFDVSYQRAGRMMEEDVAIMKEELHRGLNLSLGAVGSLSMGAEGQIIFKSGNPETFSVDSYGLAPFHLKTWESMQEDKTQPEAGKQRKNMLYIPVNRRVLRIVTAAAVGIALFFLLSTPVREINRDTYKAGFIPEIPSTRPGSPLEEPIPENDSSLTPEEYGAIAEEEHQTDTIKENIARAKPETIKPITRPATRETPKDAIKETTKETETYYIVIASVSSRKQADEFIAYNVDAATPNVGTISSGTQIRVYADKFTDKSRAEAYLAKIKSAAKYPGAWIFAQKK